MEVINFSYYNPKNMNFIKAGKNDREFVRVYSCSNKESCSLYKNGYCAMLDGLFGQPCPYGKVDYREGFTKAARKCGELIAKTKAMYPDKAYALKTPKRIGIVGDYFYTHLPYLYETRTSFKPLDSDIWSAKRAANQRLINLKYFTPETIVELIKFKPFPWFGSDPIKDYQEKYIPEFCFQLKKYYPDMFEKVKAIYPKIEEIADVSFVGKKAKLSTLKNGRVRMNSDTFEWDGKKLTFVYSKYSVLWGTKGKIYIEITAEGES